MPSKNSNMQKALTELLRVKEFVNVDEMRNGVLKASQLLLQGVGLADEERRGVRHKMPDSRPSATVKFEHGNLSCFVIVGFYPDTHRPGEVFVKVSKEGSTVQALVDVWARFASYLLQHGADIQWILSRIRHHNFEPTVTRDDGTRASILDSVADAVQEACDHYGSTGPQEPPRGGYEDGDGGGTPVPAPPSPQSPQPALSVKIEPVPHGEPTHAEGTAVGHGSPAPGGSEGERGPDDAGPGERQPDDRAG